MPFEKKFRAEAYPRLPGNRMPTRKKGHGRRRRMRGRGFMDFIGKANSFLKNSKLISTVGSALGAAGVPYAGQIAGVAGKLGYGRPRRHRGLGLHLAGGYRRY
jgi:hypothetical protein